MTSGEDALPAHRVVEQQTITGDEAEQVERANASGRTPAVSRTRRTGSLGYGNNAVEVSYVDVR